MKNFDFVRHELHFLIHEKFLKLLYQIEIR